MTIALSAKQPRQNNFYWWGVTSANWGPDSRFILKAIIKALISKLSRSSILKTPNRLHPIHNFQPDSSLSNYLFQCSRRFKNVKYTNSKFSISNFSELSWLDIKCMRRTAPKSWAIYYIFGQVWRSKSKVNVHWCEFFGHVHRFWSYLFGHLDSVMWVFLL